MCKEADEPEQHTKEPVKVEIPDNLPDVGTPPEKPEKSIEPPQHNFTFGESGNITFEEAPLSDVNLSARAR